MNLASRYHRWQRRRPVGEPVRPTRDPAAEEIARIGAAIDRLEAAATIGSGAAAARLVEMAEDYVGQARRQLARDALERLYSREPIAVRTI